MSIEAFALILSCPHVSVGVASEAVVNHAGTSRARRFLVSLPIRFRLNGTRTWFFGVTENLSQTGLLLRTGWTVRGPHLRPEACGSRMELAIELPDPTDSTKMVLVRCDGRIARIEAPERPGASVLIGVSVEAYTVSSAEERTVEAPAVPAEASQAPPVPTTQPPAPSLDIGGRRSVGRSSAIFADGVRRFPRASLSQHSTLWADVYPERGDAPASGRVATLGAGGAFVELGRDYPLGSLLSLRFKLPPNFSEIVCWGVVRNSLHGRGVGVEFSDLESADRDRIASFVTLTEAES